MVGELLEFTAMLVDSRLKMLFRPTCIVLVTMITHESISKIIVFAVSMRWYQTQVIVNKHIAHVPRQLSRKYLATVSVAAAGGSTYISRVCFDKYLYQRSVRSFHESEQVAGAGDTASWLLYVCLSLWWW